MNKISYQNTVKMLNFCQETFREFSKYEPEEKAKMITNLTLDNSKPIVTDLNLPTKDAGPLAERVVVGTAYMTEIFKSFMKYIIYLTRVNFLFSPLNLFCDYKRKNAEVAENMLVKLQELADGVINDTDLEELAKYIDTINSRKRTFWIRLICGIVVYADIAIMIALMIFK